MEEKTFRDREERDILNYTVDNYTVDTGVGWLCSV